MAAHANRVCSECGAELPADSRRDRKTCSDKCRNDRRARMQRNRSAAGQESWGGSSLDPEMAKEVEAGALLEVLKVELTPVVRERLGEHTLDAIARMLELFPKVIAALETDLAHPSPQVRQNAAKLILQYSLSDKNVPPAPKPPQKIELVGMPDVTALPQHTGREGTSEAEPTADAVEVKECSRCGEEKELVEFEANAPRCRSCQAEVRAGLALVQA